MKDDRTVRQQLTAKYPDNRTSPQLQRCQVASDGRLWASDGQAFVRLNDSGVVDRVLGGKPDPEILQEVGEVEVTGKGQIYAVDSRTASVHVFDAEGKRLMVLKSNPTDFEMKAGLFKLAVMDNQEVYLSSAFDRMGQFLQFSADGKRLGFDSLFWWKWKASSIGPTLYPRAGLGRWVVDLRHIGLLNAKGGVERVIDRDPAGKWFQHLHGGAVAPDGTLAVLSGNSPLGTRQLKLLIYDPTGKPIQSLDLPFLQSSYAPMAFDGERIALLHEKSILFLSAKGQPIGVFAPNLNGKEKGHIGPYLPAQQKELWVHDGAGTMLRYSRPQ
jgi:hypothetical protein